MGAGLLAKAVSHSLNVLADLTPSRASPLPQGFNKSQTTKSPHKAGFLWTLAFSVPDSEYGAADGTRTRDPRRDRPVF
ncbi:hypothetical protein EMIT0347P_120009 [Pseudomonas sp. IT-347P]